MISIRGTKLVRLQRRKQGLDFSIKGGREHGIGVVVSWIKEGGAAAKDLHLGDEIVAVNGRSLQGLSHGQVVEALKGAGQNVSLLVKPNQTLEDVFLGGNQTHSMETYTPPAPSRLERTRRKPSPQGKTLPPLPQGWGRKRDQKTGRLYFENHYTCCTTWTDPLTLELIPLDIMEWNTLPPGWERFLDSQGDIYYVNHHTQTTHWECPRGNRERKLLKQLKEFIQTQKDKLREEEEVVENERKILLEKNQQLSLLPPPSSESHHLSEEEGNSQPDLIDDIMMLNEEVDARDTHLNGVRRHVDALTSILYSSMADPVGDHQVSASLALALATRTGELHALVKEVMALVDTINQLHRKKAPSLTTPLQYMLQLPTQMEIAELEERQDWIHVLPDKLTAKTNCELRLELALAQEMLHYGQQLQGKLEVFRSHTLSQHGWEMEELASLDFLPLREYCIKHDPSFQEKLDKLLISL